MHSISACISRIFIDDIAQPSHIWQGWGFWQLLPTLPFHISFVLLMCYSPSLTLGWAIARAVPTPQQTLFWQGVQNVWICCILFVRRHNCHLTSTDITACCWGLLVSLWLHFLDLVLSGVRCELRCLSVSLYWLWLQQETRAAFELWPVNSSPQQQPGNHLCGSRN